MTGALADPRPEVRAAAARVLFVTGMRLAATRLAAALDAETVSDAAFEEGRALAHLAGHEHDSRIVDAWRRTGAAPLLLTLASARGPAALALLPALRMTPAPEIPLAAYIRVASRGDRALLTSIAMSAIKDADAELLAAALEAARAVDAAVPDGVLVNALQPASSTLGTVALWHFLQGWEGDERPQVSETLRSAILAFVAAHAGIDPASTFTHELAARGAGRAPRADQAWMALLTDRTAGLTRYGTLRSVRALLSAREADALNRTYETPAALLREKPLPRGNARDTPVLRTATGYPNGFMEAILSGTGCKASEGGGLGELRFHPGGNASGIGLFETGVPRRCVEAVRLLLMTYTREPDRMPADNERNLVMVPLFREYVACQADVHAGATTAPEMEKQPPARTIRPPKKIKDVKPIYPPSALTDRVEGTVTLEALITKSGCISQAVVIRSIDPRLDLAAVVGVLRWRFTPVLVDGVPSEAVVEVTVNFTL